MEALDCDDAVESKYFGEYLQKSRVKLDGHSFKRNPDFGKANKEVCIERKADYVPFTDGVDKTHELEVTDIDNYFDYGFWKGGYGSNRNLNTPDKWEDIEDLLTENAVKVTREFSRYNGHSKIHYDIPVSGHFLVPNTSNRKKNHQDNHDTNGWFFWKGKYYDPSFIYSYYYHYNGFFSHSERLTPICPLRKGSDDPLMRIGRVDAKLNRFTARTYSANISSYKTKKENVNQNSKKQYLEVDFGKIYTLTHIGTLGAYPRRLEIFPDSKEYSESSWYYSRGGRRGRGRNGRRKKRKFLYIVKEGSEEIAWVERYSIYYRDLLTGKWISYQTLQGNTDIATEVRHSVSVMTRYLRIVPLEYYHRKEMRVLFYGESTVRESNDGTVASYKGKRKNDHHLQENDGKNMKTVRYTITPAVSSSLIFDGYPDHSYYYNSSLSKNRMKQIIVRDELDAFYHSQDD
jgi:hypothetical protein